MGHELQFPRQLQAVRSRLCWNALKQTFAQSKLSKRNKLGKELQVLKTWINFAIKHKREKNDGLPMQVLGMQRGWEQGAEGTARGGGMAEN